MAQLNVCFTFTELLAGKRDNTHIIIATDTLDFLFIRVAGKNGKHCKVAYKFSNCYLSFLNKKHIVLTIDMTITVRYLHCFS